MDTQPRRARTSRQRSLLQRQFRHRELRSGCRCSRFGPVARKYWLMKSEPNVYSIDDLRAAKVDHWDGVRNYQARNTMRDDMRVGDLVLFYHSNAKPPGVAGTAEIAKAAYPDHTAFDKRSKYYDSKSDPDDPRWFMVDVKFRSKFPEFVPLDALKQAPGLEEMLVTRKGQRLSVQPVTAQEWRIVLRLGGESSRRKRPR